MKPQNKDVTVIYNAVSEQAITWESEKEQKEKSEIKILTYAGNLGYLQGLDVLIEAFKEVQAKKNTKIGRYIYMAEEQKKRI